jgi:hypothetical protein
MIDSLHINTVQSIFNSFIHYFISICNIVFCSNIYIYWIVSFQFVIKSPWVSPHYSDHDLRISQLSPTPCVHTSTFHTSNIAKPRRRRRSFPVSPSTSIQNQTNCQKHILISLTAIKWRLFFWFMRIKEVFFNSFVSQASTS